jgi:phage gp29-like protein
MIPETQIPNTSENREIVQVVEKYRQAIENRDIKALKSLVSRKYYENASTTSDDSDDYGYAQLEEKILPLLKDNIKNVQYVITLKKIEVKDEKAFADYEYNSKFFYVEGGKEQWSAKNDFNRLEFIKEDGVWRILRGL